MTKYEIIKQEIKEQIKDNILKPNQVIKSENEMCQCYKVSRVTVRKAIDELCAEGILYRIKGKGCFVRELADQRYLENKIRESFGFKGTSLKFFVRERKERDN